MLTIDPVHRLVEGVASDGRTIWVSSVLDRQILACGSECRTLAILPAGLSPLGIAWDWSRDLIWVAADCPKIPGASRCASGSLIALGRGGSIVARYSVPGSFHPGDVSVSLLSVFVGDSESGVVYGLLPRRRDLRPINRESHGSSAQGTAISPEGTSVIVADYARGIGRVDLRTGATTWLPGPGSKPLRGIDGLIRCGDRYFGVENATNPGQVVSISARDDGIDWHVVPGASNVADPTQIAFDGKRLLAVSGSGWQYFPDRIRPAGSVARIVQIPLPRGCNS